jgi:hypothetical protein
MKQKLVKAFQKIKYEVNLDSPEKIWQVIVLREKHFTLIKLWSFVAMGVFSFIGLIPVFTTLLSDLKRSGFYEYLSLAFSSSGSIIVYWKDFLLLLAESLPVISIISLFILIFIFFLSVKYAMKQIVKSQLTLSF